MSKIGQNVKQVLDRMATAAQKRGRSPESVRLIAVSKGFGPDEVAEAASMGITDFGENRVQEAIPKAAVVTLPVKWHLIGTLQRNKVNAALPLFSYIHSVDRIELVEALSKRLHPGRASPACLLQVNIAGESTKHGVHPDMAVELARQAGAAGLNIQGLMTMAPFTSDPESVRWVFRSLRELACRIEERQFPGVQMVELSMGMSNDFEVAVEEGATLVRVGSAIFGRREA